MYIENIIERYGSAVYSYAMLRLKNTDDAADVYQNVFLKLFEKKPQFPDFKALRVWMIRCAVKLIANHFRKSQNRDILPLEQRADIAVTDPLEFELCDMLSTLPEVFREVTVLYYIDDMSVNEIASALKVSQGTVKSRLARARRRLEELYKNI